MGKKQDKLYGSLLSRESFQAVVQGGENKQSPPELLSCGYKAERPERPRQLDFTNQSTRQMRGTKRLDYGEQHRVP